MAARTPPSPATSSGSFDAEETNVHLDDDVSIQWGVDYEDMTQEEYDRAIDELYKPRAPMDKLPLKYLPTEDYPEPPLLHFGIPVSTQVVFDYAGEQGVVRYFKHMPDEVSPTTLRAAIKRLGEVCNYDFNIEIPLLAPRGCSMLVQLYSNYSMDEKRLIPEDERDVIEMVRTELDLDMEVQPRWYFDCQDPWRPGDEVD